MQVTVLNQLNNGSGPDDGMICGETGGNRITFFGLCLGRLQLKSAMSLV